MVASVGRLTGSVPEDVPVSERMFGLVPWDRLDSQQRMLLLPGLSLSNVRIERMWSDIGRELLIARMNALSLS